MHCDNYYEKLENSNFIFAWIILIDRRIVSACGFFELKEKQ